MQDPTVRTAKRSDNTLATSAKYSKGRENSFMLRDTSTKTQTSVGMTSGHGGGSLTARSEGGMRFPMRSDDITAQCALIVKSNKENTFLQKDASSEHTSKSDIESPLFEDDEENEFEK